MTCLLGFFTSERSSVLSPHTLPSLEPAKNSAKMSPLHHKVSKENNQSKKQNKLWLPILTNPLSLGDSAWQIVLFFWELQDFSHAVFVWCGLSSPVCCNPIPMKAFFSSLGICVPWCPQVNHDCSKAIKCCSGVPSHSTLSQRFHLAHCLPLQPKKYQR